MLIIKKINFSYKEIIKCGTVQKKLLKCVCLLFKKDVQQYNHQWSENHFILRDPKSQNNLKYKTAS